MRCVFTFMVYLFLVPCMQGQERLLEQMMEDQAIAEEEREQEEDLQQLHIFLKKPVNLNVAERDLLSLFPFLTAQQIEQFVIYRRMVGPLVDVLELQAVPAWDVETVRRIKPFVTVAIEEPLQVRLQREISKARQQLLLRTTAGRDPSLLLRYGAQLPNLRFGFSMDKDRGEKLFQPGKGISFFSAHASIKGKGLLKHLLVGDHLVNLGQGLMLWQGRGFRKSGATVMVKRQLPVFQEYRSSDENRFMRGFAVSLGRNRVGADLFLSRNLQDANVGIDSTGKKEVKSFLYSGIHRTEGELNDKNALEVLSAGISIHYSYRHFRIAYQEVGHRFSIPINRGTDFYELLSFRGNRMHGRSLSYHHTWRNMHCFGEVAMGGMGTAMLNGIMVAADKKLDAAIVGRRIGRNYSAYGANAFTEYSGVSNEEGIYVGLQWRPLPTVAVDVYADHFRSPWLRYRVDGPSIGSDRHLQFSWRPTRQSLLLIRWRRDEKMQNISAETAMRGIAIVPRETLRVHLERRLTELLEWRSRLEWVWTRPAGGIPENGFYMYTDVFFRHRKQPFSGNARLMFLATGGFASRLYAYENDVMFYSLIPSFYGKGIIAYMNIRIQPTDRLGLFLKWHFTGKEGAKMFEMRSQLVFTW